MTDTKEAIELVEKAERRIFVPLECKDLLDQALALLRQAQEPECKTCKDKKVVQIECEACTKDIPHPASECGGEKPCPDCQAQEQPRHYTCSKCGKTFPKYMGKEFRDHVTYCEPKEQPPVMALCPNCQKSICGGECLGCRLDKLQARLKDLLAACKELIENEPHGITPYFDEALRKIEDILNKEISGKK